MRARRGERATDPLSSTENVRAVQRWETQISGLQRVISTPACGAELRWTKEKRIFDVSHVACWSLFVLRRGLGWDAAARRWIGLGARAAATRRLVKQSTKLSGPAHASQSALTHSDYRYRG